MKRLIADSDQIFIPSGCKISTENIWRWYQNIIQEWSSDRLTDDEIAYSRNYYFEAGLSCRAKRKFFKAHYADSFCLAATYLLDENPHGTILDLGCGTGTQSLYFALQGARVIAADLDRVALKILEKRKEFYSRKAGRSLDIEIVCGNCHDFKYLEHGPIDAIYSMFSFNMMQPSDELLGKIIPSLSDDARIAIIDGNNKSWLGRFVPTRKRKVWSPTQFAEHLNNLGFTIDAHSGGIALPPFIWRLPFGGTVKWLDHRLRRSWFFSISHQILARRTSQ